MTCPARYRSFRYFSIDYCSVILNRLVARARISPLLERFNGVTGLTPARHVKHNFVIRFGKKPRTHI